MKYRIKIETRNDEIVFYTPQVKFSRWFSKWENILIDQLKHVQTSTSSSRSYREYWRAAEDIETHKGIIKSEESKKIKETKYDYK